MLQAIMNFILLFCKETVYIILNLNRLDIKVIRPSHY
jgi:hypothetical protein